MDIINTYQMILILILLMVFVGANCLRCITPQPTPHAEGTGATGGGRPEDVDADEGICLGVGGTNQRRPRGRSADLR